jgi:hypothetical protein
MKSLALIVILPVVAALQTSTASADPTSRAMKDKIMGCLRDPKPCIDAGMGSMGYWHSIHTVDDDTGSINFRACNYPKIEKDKPFVPAVVLDDDVVVGYMKRNGSVSDILNSTFSGMLGTCRKDDELAKSVRDQITSVHFKWMDGNRDNGSLDPIVELKGKEMIVTIFPSVVDPANAVAAFLAKNLK